MSVTEHHGALSDLLRFNGSRASREVASEAAKRVPTDDSTSYGVGLVSQHQKEGLISAFAVKIWSGVSFTIALLLRLKCALPPWCSIQHSVHTTSALLLQYKTPRATDLT